MNFKCDNKELKAIASVYKYAINKTDESENNRQNILKEINLNYNNFNFSNLIEYREKLCNFAFSIIESFEKESILFFAEFLREQYCNNEFPKRMLDHYMSITEAGIYIQKIALQKNCSFRKTASFNRSRLCLLLETLFMYELLDMKIKFSINNSYVCNFESLFLPLAEDEIDSYFEKYDLYFRVEKPEERMVYNPQLREYLLKKKLTPAAIYLDADHVLKEVLGFTYSDIDTVVNNIEKQIHKFNISKKCLTGQHHVRIKKEELVNLFTGLVNKDSMESMLSHLSLNMCIEKNIDSSNRMLELRCIVEDGDVLSFGLCTIKECLLILKAISLPGHFPNEIGITKDKNALFGEFQNKLSQYFSYMVGDLFQQNGFHVPLKESGLIKVELNTIQLSNKKLIFKDIDVLALDVVNKKLYNCELKYYKVKIDYQSMLTDALENKKYENFLKRQRILEDNKEQILEEIFGITNLEGYCVCPIVITSRVNNNTKQVPEYSFEELKRKVLNKEVL
ncbi:hypothetical protein [Clostridium sp. BL-8]|uniref:hypothetical protein n=1 Tax=Clostridium sp. BL-8 TaxID=349938 RepID=UPI00098CA348|nr:hypothetical protein [Clostridium sp. BL-8]OOM79126.1 hypothetical protein CLOBL_17980 [Clostridium sp. BL-8]